MVQCYKFFHYMCISLTNVQSNFTATFSGSFCQVNDHSGSSCQQTVVSPSHLDSFWSSVS